MVRRGVGRVVVHGSAGHVGPGNIDVRHGECRGGSGGGSERLFCESLCVQCWSGEEQGKR
jgi:hypothetical protein